MPSAAISWFDRSPGDPLAQQRARGAARIGFREREGRTVLGRLYQEGAVKVLLPKVAAGAPPEAVLINTAGGLTGGDMLSFDAAVDADCRAIITTQASEKIYRAAIGEARIETNLSVGAGGRIDWLPQETILYDEARLTRRFSVDLDKGARLLAVESVIFGRTAMGEAVISGAFRDRWRIRREGSLIFADDVKFDGAVSEMLARPAILAGATALGNIIYVDDEAERFVKPVRELIECEGGASGWDGKLVVRLVAPDGLALRRRLIPILGTLLAGAPLPKAWSV